MALDPKALSAIKSNHARERAEMVERHGAEKRQLSHMAADRRKREVEQSRKHGGKSDTRLKGADADVQDRVKEHAKLKAKQDKEYSAMTARHKNEISEAEKTGKLPAKHAAPVGMHEVQDQWGRTTPKDRDDYQKIVRHYDQKRKDVDTAADARRDRMSRYRSSAVQSSLERDRLEKHDAENKKQQSALADLRRRVERRHEVA